MTREEAIEYLKILKEDYWDDDGYGHETKKYDDTMLALDMAIKALEQEPCEDCVSRQKVIDALTKTSGIRGDALKALYDLPPVTPKPKMGHWIDHQDGRWIYAKCSECGKVQDAKSNFCPYCGVDMREVEE